MSEMIIKLQVRFVLFLALFPAAWLHQDSMIRVYIVGGSSPPPPHTHTLTHTRSYTHTVKVTGCKSLARQLLNIFFKYYWLRLIHGSAIAIIILPRLDEGNNLLTLVLMISYSFCWFERLGERTSNAMMYRLNPP